MKKRELTETQSLSGSVHVTLAWTPAVTPVSKRNSHDKNNRFIFKHDT